MNRKVKKEKTDIDDIDTPEGIPLNKIGILNITYAQQYPDSFRCGFVADGDDYTVLATSGRRFYGDEGHGGDYARMRKNNKPVRYWPRNHIHDGKDGYHHLNEFLKEIGCPIISELIKKAKAEGKVVDMEKHYSENG